jgi:hypothetical protein
MGIATSNVNINPAYNSAGSNDVLTAGGVFLPGATMDGLVQGTINVTCYNGTPTAGGSVWMRVASDSAIPAGVVGGLEAATDPNPITTTGATTGASVTLTPGAMTGIEVGMSVTGTNLAANTTVAAVGVSTVTLSQASLGTVSGNVVFSHTVLLTNLKWKTGFLEVDDTAQVTILARTIA